MFNFLFFLQVPRQQQCYWPNSTDPEPESEHFLVWLHLEHFSSDFHPAVCNSEM